MSWTQRIIESTGATPRPRDIDLAPIEGELGTALPADYRELCSSLGGALYNGYLSVLQPVGDVDSLLYWLRVVRGNAGLYRPHVPYGGPGQPGLLQWGTDQTEGEYYWLADAGADPDSWPVVARKDGVDPWHRYEMTMSEFTFRMLTDRDFTPFTVAGWSERPFVIPEGVEINTAEEWNAWANRS
ncbi:hypothetical protein [Actinoplanes sp. NPDC051411]|uniref:hypothetical protein n=1 Tax=Actinoplanes sp. NPDC051411 TaxID=3155522 RepID=UPI00342EB241